MEFTNKVILVTGASAGIGAATAQKFASLGANLAIVGRNAAKLENFADSLEKKYKTKVLPIVADVSIELDVERIVQDTIANFGKLDVLVNNAGFGNGGGLLDGIAPYDDLMATNVRGVYMVTSYAAPQIIDTKGSIINVSSVLSQIPGLKILPYRMSKAALDMFTKCTALELAPHGVRVNSVNPGYTKTNILRAKGLTEEQSDAAFEYVAKEVPPQRVSETDEIADMITYLAGEKAKGMTGTIVFIDNGHLAKGYLESSENPLGMVNRVCDLL